MATPLAAGDLPAGHPGCGEPAASAAGAATSAARSAGSRRSRCAGRRGRRPPMLPEREPRQARVGRRAPDVPPQPVAPDRRGERAATSRSRAERAAARAGLRPGVASRRPRQFDRRRRAVATMRLGPAPIDPEIDDVAPSRRGSGAGEAPSGDMDAPARRRRSRAPLLLLLLILVLAAGSARWPGRSAARSPRSSPPSTSVRAEVSGDADRRITAAARPRPPTRTATDSAARHAGSGVRQVGGRTGRHRNGRRRALRRQRPRRRSRLAAVARARRSAVAADAGAGAPAQPQAALAPAADLHAAAGGGAGSDGRAEGDPLRGAGRSERRRRPSTLAIAGTVTWSYVAERSERSGDRGERLPIPDRKMKVKFTIRTNTDTSAAGEPPRRGGGHTPADFPGKGIQQRADDRPEADRGGAAASR